MYKSSREQVIHSVIFKDFFKVLAKAFLTPLKTQTKSIKIMSFFRITYFCIQFAVLRKNEIISLCWNKCVKSYQKILFLLFCYYFKNYKSRKIEKKKLEKSKNSKLARTKN